MALMGLASWGGGGERLAVLGGGPNVFGRNMAVLLMISLSAILTGRSKRWLWILGATLGAVLALLSGSRGAIVGTMAGTATLVYAKRLPIGRFVKIGIGLVVFAWFVVTFTDAGQQALTSFEERFLVLTLEERHDAGRMDLYVYAWNMGLDAPLIGQGLAAFAVSGFHVYPHNIVLEASCEGGLVGVALLLAVLVPTLRRVFEPEADQYTSIERRLARAPNRSQTFDSRPSAMLMHRPPTSRAQVETSGNDPQSVDALMKACASPLQLSLWYAMILVPPRPRFRRRDDV